MSSQICMCWSRFSKRKSDLQAISLAFIKELENQGVKVGTARLAAAHGTKGCLGKGCAGNGKTGDNGTTVAGAGDAWLRARPRRGYRCRGPWQGSGGSQSCLSSDSERSKEWQGRGSCSSGSGSDGGGIGTRPKIGTIKQN